MLARNMGQTDRIIRTVLGAVLIVSWFMVSGSFAWLLPVVGLVLLATAAMGSCPPYALLGISTCKTKQ